MTTESTNKCELEPALSAGSELGGAPGSERRREVSLGAMEPPLTEQLKGLMSAENLDHLDRDAKAITRCHIRGLLSDRESDTARRRLIKRIERTLEASPNK